MVLPRDDITRWDLKLIDLAAARRHDKDLTYNTRYHTPGWAAPERLGVTGASTTSCTFATDVWAFGVLAIQILRRDQPWVLPNEFKTLPELCRNGSPYITTVNINSSDHKCIDVSRWLNVGAAAADEHYLDDTELITLVNECMIIDPTKRPHNMQNIQARLTDFRHDAGY